MTITVEELMGLCNEAGICEVTIYDIEKCEGVWTGYGDEIPKDYADLAIESFDAPEAGKLTLNV